MRLLYVAVVASLVSMILIGSYLNTLAGTDRVSLRPMIKNVREFGDMVKAKDVLFGIFKKYKTGVWQLFPLGKELAAGRGQSDSQRRVLLSS
jgi:hypothetical protein